MDENEELKFLVFVKIQKNKIWGGRGGEGLGWGGGGGVDVNEELKFL